MLEKQRGQGPLPYLRGLLDVPTGKFTPASDPRSSAQIRGLFLNPQSEIPPALICAISALYEGEETGTSH